MSKALRLIEGELKKTGLPWRVEHGKKHHKIYLNDAMVGVFSIGTTSENTPGFANLRATIRRNARGQSGQCLLRSSTGIVATS
jgi:hypothetical protein